MVLCSKGELPRVGEQVHVEQQDGEVYLVGETCRLKACNKIDEYQDDIDMTYIHGTVHRLEDMYPTPGSYPDRMTEQQIIEMHGETHLVWISIAATGEQRATAQQ